MEKCPVERGVVTAVGKPVVEMARQQRGDVICWDAGEAKGLSEKNPLVETASMVKVLGDKTGEVMDRAHTTPEVNRRRDKGGKHKDKDPFRRDHKEEETDGK